MAGLILHGTPDEANAWQEQPAAPRVRPQPDNVAGAIPQSPPPDIGDSFSKEAPVGAHAPPDPRAIAGVWTLRQPGRPGPYEIKPDYREKVPAYVPPLPPGSAPGPSGNSDPAQLCIPTAFFGDGTYPTQIIQTPGRVTIINEENHRIRRIYLDAQHPADLRPSYSGHSIGHWEGDTLVVETVAIRPRGGETLPPGYRVLERFHKARGGRVLEQQITFDSAAYSKPSRETVTYNWRPDLHLQEEICEEFSDPYGNDYYGHPGGK
jgi:hypothetical protein